jgi:GNAT superfamily N-acetyltransferase
LKNDLKIKQTTVNDSELILSFIKKLAEYENLLHEVKATATEIEKSLFSKDSNAEAIIGYIDESPVAIAIYFHNYSTFLAKKGLYLEDLFVLPEFRKNGIGKKMLKYLANLAVERDCGRFEWAVLDWNEPAIQFYQNIGAELKKEWIITRLEGDSITNFIEQK